MENEQVENLEVEVQETEQVEQEAAIPQTLDELIEDNKKLQDELAEIKQMRKDIFEKQVSLTLQENGLEAFANIIKVENVEELTGVVNKLNKIVNDIKIANSYQPKDNATQDSYSVHTNNKDTKSMIGSKLANLFK